MLGVLVDWVGSAVIVMLALVFGLAGLCLVLAGAANGVAGSGPPQGRVWFLIPVAIGVGFLLGAVKLLGRLRRRRKVEGQDRT